MADIPALTARVLERAGVPCPRLSVVVLNRSAGGGDSLVVLAFPTGGREPTHVLKFTEDAAHADDLKIEYENLTDLHATGSPRLVQGLPRPVHFGEIAGTVVFAETALAGNRMKNLPPRSYFRSRRFRRHLALVVEWLGEFHRWSRGGGRKTGFESREALVTSIDRFRAGFDRSRALDSLLDETCVRLGGRELPGSPAHGDFCSANILICADGGLGIVDWENPIGDRWPLSDLLHFLTSVWVTPYAKGPAALAANFEAMFFERHGLSADVRAAGLGYALTLGVDAADLLPLSVMAWVDLANQKRRRVSGFAAAGQWPLTLIDGKSCLNLEILARRRDDYVFRP